jgi:predicted RecB family nuclease
MESHTMGLNGRPDLIVRTDDGLYIWDWKTSPNLYPETRLEMAAYALLAAEKYGQPVIGLVAMRLDYAVGGSFSPEKDLLKIDDYGEDAIMFQKLLDVFRPLQAWQAKNHS